MNIARFFFERPYLARHESVPEKSGIAYYFHLFVGLKFWLRHEMPLLPAWGVAILSFALLLGSAFVERISAGAWWGIPLLIVGLPFAILGQVALTIVAIVSVLRLGDRLARMWNATASWVTKIWHMAWDPIHEALRAFWTPIAVRTAEGWSKITNRLERIGAWLVEEPRGQIILTSLFVAAIVAFAWHDPDYFVFTLKEIWTEHDWFFTAMKYLFGLWLCLIALNITLILVKPLIRKLRK